MQQDLKSLLSHGSKKWLVTGSAGFIGSHLLETLLVHGQHVTSLDNFSTGFQENLDNVKHRVGHAAWQRHDFIKGDVQDLDTCQKACREVDYVLHQAALGSVPRSINDPLISHGSNVNGFLNMLVAARDAKVRRFVFASSSATYGDHPGLPKFEDEIGNPLSPYAVTKYVNELYAQVFGTCYGLRWVGLRYFNVFGARQDPNGAYAAVIPKWTQALVDGDDVVINGDGETSRDFCYIANTVQANLRAALIDTPDLRSCVYNVAVGDRTTLNQLYNILKDLVREFLPGAGKGSAIHGPFREGDVRHSLADIERAKTHLGFSPTHRLAEGLRETVQWYVAHKVSEVSKARAVGGA